MGLARSILSTVGILPHLQKMNIPHRLGMMQFPTFDQSTHRSLSRVEDYFRQATIGLAVQRIVSENILGSFAEVGVYRGDTSKLIHQLAPQRKYFLFDTFEGFPEQDLEANAGGDKRFSDVTVDNVLRNIGNADNLVVRKGYVPDTLAGLESEQFAFVLLDLDLYPPTARSIEFFYPRLTKGAYLLVHDYNNPESNWACKRAVNEFMEDKVEKIIEIADQWGTVMFRKT